MLALKKPFIRSAIESAGYVDCIVGRATSGAELIRQAEKNDLTLAPSARDLALSTEFRCSQPRSVNVAFVTPRELGFSKKPTPPDIRQRALAVGLMLCPDDLAYERQRWGRYPLNRKPYLYAIRYIVPKWAPCFVQMTPIHSEMLVVSTWHGQAEIDLDIDIGLVVPDTFNRH